MGNIATQSKSTSDGTNRFWQNFTPFFSDKIDNFRGQIQNDDNLKSNDNLKNEDKPKNKEDIKHEEDLNNEDSQKT